MGGAGGGGGGCKGGGKEARGCVKGGGRAGGGGKGKGGGDRASGGGVGNIKTGIHTCIFYNGQRVIYLLMSHISQSRKLIQKQI